MKMDQSTQVDFPIVVRKMRRHNTSADLFVNRGQANSWVSIIAPPIVVRQVFEYFFIGSSLALLGMSVPHRLDI